MYSEYFQNLDRIEYNVTDQILILLYLSYKELSELVEATSEQLVDYQMSLIATTILHDAPSQNWTSQKPFYEGEL